jgi:Family of unknown function (DUF6496)
MATRRQTPEQKETIERVMHEFKHGELETGRGRKVRNPKQAIAIALHEAGASRDEAPARNRENLERTKARERAGAGGDDGGSRRGASRGSGETTRAALYAEAKRRGIPGRSRMGRAELERALRG